MKKVIKTRILIVLSFASFMCHTSIIASEQYSPSNKDTSFAIKEVGKDFDARYPSPPSVNRIEDRKTALGVDANNNGVRDLVESTMLTVIWDASEPKDYDKNYNDVMTLVREIQPEEHYKRNTKSEKKIKCLYGRLDENIKQLIDYDSLMYLMLETGKRYSNFGASTIPENKDHYICAHKID